MSKDKSFQKFKDITAAMKAEIKAKHPGAIVFSLPVNEDEAEFESVDWSEKASFVLAPPDRSTMNALKRYGAEDKIMQFERCLKKNCVLGGDMELLEEDVNEFVYRSVLRKCGKLIKAAEGEVEKL